MGQRLWELANLRTLASPAPWANEQDRVWSERGWEIAKTFGVSQDRNARYIAAAGSLSVEVIQGLLTALDALEMIIEEDDEDCGCSGCLAVRDLERLS